MSMHTVPYLQEGSIMQFLINLKKSFAIYAISSLCDAVLRSPLLEFKAPRPQYLPLILNVNRKL